ncbi:MAG TPA: TadE/TadG family type IV pilus assembly protein [Acidimicrobiales bacterium]|nr:TadE/TadG family type IV pilus assembly protein [Acidimicrobiales bacterium]
MSFSRGALARGSPYHGGDSERGAAVVEAVVLVPVAMLVVLFAVQACLWAHAAAIVQTAAAQGDQEAANYGGSASAGINRAEQFIAATAASVVVNPDVSARISSDEVEIRVRGTAESVLPWFHVTVSATRSAPIEMFRSS